MGYEEIFDPIEVLTHFRNGKMLPLKFLWNGRAYKVKRVNTQWVEHLGTAKQIHYSIQTEDANCFELIFDSGDFAWQIARVYIEG